MNYSKSFKWGCIGSCSVIAIIGLAFLFFPGFLMSFISTIAGISLIIFGIILLIKSIMDRKTLYFSPFRIVLSSIIIIVGITFLIQQSMPYYILSFCFAVFSFISAITKMNVGMELKHSGQPYGWYITNSIIGMVFGFFLLVSPLITIEIMVRIMGAYWAYLAIYSGVSILINKDRYIL